MVLNAGELSVETIETYQKAPEFKLFQNGLEQYFIFRKCIKKGTKYTAQDKNGVIYERFSDEIDSKEEAVERLLREKRSFEAKENTRILRRTFTEVEV